MRQGSRASDREREPGTVVDLGTWRGSTHGRPFLLIQGPVGPFFAELSRTLRKRGHPVDRVRLNAADRLFDGPIDISAGDAGAFRSLRFKEGSKAFEPWLRGLCWRNHYAAIVLFGGERPAHKVARTVAAEFGIPVIALEEGYVRNGFVTVERNGNNARSPLAGETPPSDFDAPVPKGTPSKGYRWMLWWAFLSFTWRNVASRRIEREFDHKQRGTISEGFFWLRSAFRYAMGYGDSIDQVLKLPSFDLVALQVSDDAQLGEAADGWDNRKVIAATIESLARHAPRNRHLVFKVHPMERGHTRDLPLIRTLAQRWGVVERVHCVTVGSIGTLAHAARGMITINSTSGFSALHAQRPLLMLGRGVYRHPKLVTCGGDQESIDRFWTSTRAVEPGLAERFERWLKVGALVPGDFYDRAVMAETAERVAARAIELAENGPYRVPVARIGEVRQQA